MAPFLSSGTLGDALSKLSIVTWHKGFDSVPAAARRVFSTRMTSGKTSEHDSWDYDGFASSTGEGADYSISDPIKGDSLTLTQAKITDSFEISEEAVDYDRYNQTRSFQGMLGLGKRCPKRMELDLQLFLMSFGFGTSYTDQDGATVSTTGADALAIYSNSHTINKSSTTYDNLHTTAFGQTGLETAEDLFRNFINHDGQLVQVVPDTIITTSKALVVNLVREYNKGMNHIEDANRGINVYQGRYDHIVFDFGDSDANGARDSSKDDYWLLASLANNHHAILEVSQAPRIRDAGRVQRNQNQLFVTDCRYAYGVLGNQWIVGANVS